MRAAGIDFVASVPDMHLVDLLDRVAATNGIIHVPCCREEEGVGICAGAWLAGRRPALVMQNAGLLNSANALTTTAAQFEIPMLLVVWYAGSVGDRGFHRLGEVTEPTLDALRIRAVVLRDPKTIADETEHAARLAFDSRRPVAVLATYQAFEA
jgi:sulfopyruvate decarboxylase subunit alpha